MAVAAFVGGVLDRRPLADLNVQGRPAWWVRLLAALPWWVMYPLAEGSRLAVVAGREGGNSAPCART